MKARKEQMHSLPPQAELDELQELMRSVHYPDTWFFAERATVLLFWLSATIDPALNMVQVGFPYVMRFLAERMAKRNAARLNAS